VTDRPLSRPMPLILTVLTLVGLDQAIKWWVEATLPFQQMVPVAPMLALYRTWNEGIAFSFLAGLDDLGLVALTTGVVLFVLYLWWRTPADRRIAHLGYSLIIAGALGNLIDRVTYGHVVDYVLFHTATWSFAVFNLADACISAGAGLIVLDEVLDWRRQRLAGKSDQSGTS